MKTKSQLSHRLWNRDIFSSTPFVGVSEYSRSMFGGRNCEYYDCDRRGDQSDTLICGDARVRLTDDSDTEGVPNTMVNGYIPNTLSHSITAIWTLCASKGNR